MTSSPRERGCSPGQLEVVPADRVVPARAGLFRGAPTHLGVINGRPRASGAVPEGYLSVIHRDASSPRERGCSQQLPTRLRPRAVVPARAGLFPRGSIRFARASSRPRASGAVPGLPPVSTAPHESSPRERGCSGHHVAARRPPRVVPARAGLFRTWARPPPRCRSRPRASGAVPAVPFTLARAFLSSPRERGCSGVRPVLDAGVPVVPARAGLFRSRARSCVHSSCRPRASGAVPNIPQSWFVMDRSSPRERGCSPLGGNERVVVLVVPARAGLFPSPGTRFFGGRSRPRASGAVPITATYEPCVATSSPRERGCSPAVRVFEVEGVVVPARAGLFPTAGPTRPGSSSRPRASGAVPGTEVSRIAEVGSSPRERGCSSAAGAGTTVAGVVPARAGLFRCGCRTGHP